MSLEFGVWSVELAAGASPLRRAFLMGNALVTGIVERVGCVLEDALR